MNTQIIVTRLALGSRYAANLLREKGYKCYCRREEYPNEDSITELERGYLQSKLINKIGKYDYIFVGESDEGLIKYAIKHNIHTTLIHPAPNEISYNQYLGRLLRYTKYKYVKYILSLEYEGYIENFAKPQLSVMYDRIVILPDDGYISDYIYMNDKE